MATTPPPSEGDVPFITIRLDSGTGILEDVVKGTSEELGVGTHEREGEPAEEGDGDHQEDPPSPDQLVCGCTYDPSTGNMLPLMVATGMVALGARRRKDKKVETETA